MLFKHPCIFFSKKSNSYSFFQKLQQPIRLQNKTSYKQNLVQTVRKQCTNKKFVRIKNSYKLKLVRIKNLYK